MNQEKHELHPMQLISLAVKRLHAEVHDPDEAKVWDKEVNFSFQSGHNAFDKESSSISVGVRASVGRDCDGETAESEVPFLLEVEVVGLFTIDTQRFEERMIDAWARGNAPFLLLPYVREHLYGLASRLGIRELLVPLFVQPQFRPFSDSNTSR
ncbi:protein-export chaperone SecB [Achromobacter ruhlandii]|uniref:protein-export chaperone SecB n=1 Tax=Achromobacter ruhlandii TaxID=72557 RepID=UPI0030161CBE